MNDQRILDESHIRISVRQRTHPQTGKTYPVPLIAEHRLDYCGYTRIWCVINARGEVVMECPNHESGEAALAIADFCAAAQIPANRVVDFIDAWIVLDDREPETTMAVAMEAVRKGMQ